MRNIRLSTILHSILFCLGVIGVTSCASPFVDEKARDKGSMFRGFWSITFMEPATIATTSIGRFKCWDMEGSGNLQIAGGRAVARVHGYDLGGFVDSSGRFTTSLDLNENYQFVLMGQLDVDIGTGSGRLYHARKDLGLQGCNSKVRLEKSDI